MVGAGKACWCPRNRAQGRHVYSFAATSRVKDDGCRLSTRGSPHLQARSQIRDAQAFSAKPTRAGTTDGAAAAFVRSRPGLLTIAQPGDGRRAEAAAYSAAAPRKISLSHRSAIDRAGDDHLAALGRLAIEERAVSGPNLVLGGADVDCGAGCKPAGSDGDDVADDFRAALGAGGHIESDAACRKRPSLIVVGGRRARGRRCPGIAGRASLSGSGPSRLNSYRSATRTGHG